jgi:nitrite reductase/ring-hydroxylating ferredoxin subunit/uncharacterized membrane protein
LRPRRNGVRPLGAIALALPQAEVFATDTGAAADRGDGLRGEPQSAVFAGGDGLGPYRRLAAASRERLRGDGLLVQLRGRVLTAAHDDLGAWTRSSPLRLRSRWAGRLPDRASSGLVSRRTRISTSMKPVLRQQVPQRLENLGVLDVVSEPLQKAVRALIPQGSQLKDFLSGTWLGHPLHPPLTDVVIGAWTSALFLDVTGGEGVDDAADRLVAAGIFAAVPTAAAGLSDWADLRGGSRRVGSVHAVGNTTALVLHAMSYVARRRGDRGRGITLSALGYGAATVSAWLGGHLSFGKGVGVNQTAFDDAPSEWTSVLAESELEDGRLTAAQANGVRVLLVRRGNRLYALADRCSHRGCALHTGELHDDTVTCACHGSTFRLDGSIVRGPATAPQPSYDVRINDGSVEIRRPQPAA